MHATIAVRSDLQEQLLGNIDRAAVARRAGVVDGASVRFAVVVDVDGLTTLGVGIGVGRVLHYVGSESNEILTVCALRTAAA